MKRNLELIRELIKKAEDGGVGDAEVLCKYLKECGFIAGQHVGKDPKDFTPEITAEWFLGQFISMFEQGAWYGFNSWFNCVDKFMPKDLVFEPKEYFAEDLFTA